MLSNTNQNSNYDAGNIVLHRDKQIFDKDDSRFDLALTNVIKKCREDAHLKHRVQDAKEEFTNFRYKIDVLQLNQKQINRMICQKIEKLIEKIQYPEKFYFPTQKRKKNMLRSEHAKKRARNPASGRFLKKGCNVSSMALEKAKSENIINRSTSKCSKNKFKIKRTGTQYSPNEKMPQRSETNTFHPKNEPIAYESTSFDDQTGGDTPLPSFSRADSFIDELGIVPPLASLQHLPSIIPEYTDQTTFLNQIINHKQLELIIYFSQTKTLVQVTKYQRLLKNNFNFFPIGRFKSSFIFRFNNQQGKFHY